MNFEEALVLSPGPGNAILALDTALGDFAKQAPRQARVVELRYFGGLTTEEIAEVMNTSTRSVERDWQFARSWVMREVSR